LPEIITIDGRGMSIHDAVMEMWERIQPLEERGYNPVSGVEIVDATSKEIVQSFQLSDPEFELHLKSDEKIQKRSEPKGENPHVPERKEHFKYIARIQLTSSSSK
jgi:hypothetical protein